MPAYTWWSDYTCVFDRFVQVRVGAKYTQRTNDYIIGAIREVVG